MVAMQALSAMPHVIRLWRAYLQPPLIAILSGSQRAGSHNTALARFGERCLKDAGAETALIDLADYPMPLYDFDLQARDGLPASAMALKEIFKKADGFLIASPEHNMGPSALLKNMIDWVSRAVGDESGKVPFRDRPAAICSASTGGMGGQRGLIVLRMILTGLDMHVLPAVVGVGNAAAAFNAEGNLASPAQAVAMQSLAQSLVVTARALRPASVSQ